MSFGEIAPREDLDGVKYISLAVASLLVPASYPGSARTISLKP